MKRSLKSFFTERAHPSEGELRALLDQEISRTEAARIEAHLAACPRCQEQARQLSDLTVRVGRRLDRLAPLTSLKTASPHLARARLDSFMTRKEYQPMSNKFRSRAFHPVWIALAVLALLLVSLAFQPVRAIAIDFLGLFRIQQVAVVPFNPANLPDNLNDPQFNQIFSKDLQFEGADKYQDAADAAQASDLAGFSVRLPANSSSDEVKLKVQSSGSLTFHVDLPRIRALLKEIDRGDIVLPDELDGATISAELPSAVTASLGRCKFDPQTARENGQDPDEPETFWDPQCNILVQLPSPTINTPPGLDITQIGKAYLMMTGMSAEEAEAFSQTIDWATTLVVPIPNYSGSEKVQVDGVEGIFIEQSRSHAERPRYLLVWVKEGIVYALEGQGSLSQALAIANTLE